MKHLPFADKMHLQNSREIKSKTGARFELVSHRLPTELGGNYQIDYK